jgi:hypothetical protein
MTSPHDYSPRHPGQRRVVRFIFIAVAVYFVVGLVVRKKYGEMYPALTMPSFAGIGLASMTDTAGETTLPSVVVTFSDQTTADLTAVQFAGPFLPSVVIRKFFAQDTTNTQRPVSAEAKAYAAYRLHLLFPDKSPVMAKLQINFVQFPLDHPDKLTVIGPAAEQDIVFP